MWKQYTHIANFWNCYRLQQILHDENNFQVITPMQQLIDSYQIT